MCRGLGFVEDSRGNLELEQSFIWHNCAERLGINVSAFWKQLLSCSLLELEFRVFFAE